MADLYVFETVVVAFLNNLFFYRVVYQIGGSEFLAEFVEFLDERFCFVDSRMLCFGNLEFVCGEHVQILVHSLRLKLLVVVLVVEVFEFTDVNLVAVYRH